MTRYEPPTVCPCCNMRICTQARRDVDARKPAEPQTVLKHPSNGTMSLDEAAWVSFFLFFAEFLQTRIAKQK